MNKWTVNIEEKPYFTISLTGDNSTIYTFGNLPKNGLLAKIKDYAKKNRELFLGNKKMLSAKFGHEIVKFKKIG